jgi:hypothetical protein
MSPVARHFEIERTGIALQRRFFANRPYRVCEKSGTVFSRAAPRAVPLEQLGMEPYSYLPKALFDVDLDAVTQAHVKNAVADPTGSLAVRLRQLPQSLSDALMFAPKLTFKVTGDNAPLAALVQSFGAAAVEELLRNEDIDFVLWRDNVAVTLGDA